MKKISVVAMTALVSVLTSAANAETVRWARSGDSLTLDPHAQNEGPTHNVSHQLYDPLVYRDINLDLTPGLATEWGVTDDPNIWEFTIREGVTFHEGQSLTADDVAFSLNRARHENSDMKGLLSSVVDVRAVDDFTVHVETDGPNPLLPNNLTNMFIMSREWAEANEVEAPQDYAGGEETHAVRNANGTGAFRLVSREPDVRTVMERNDDYWGIDSYPMEVSEIIFTPIQSQATQVAAILSGEIDFLMEPPVQDVERLSEAEGLKVETGPENRTIFFGMHQGKDELEYSDADGNPFAHREVREAMMLAIDADTIQRVVMRGFSDPTGAMLPPFVNGWTEEMHERPAVDQDRARELLAEAGYPDGFNITMHCPNDRYVNDEAICQAVTGMLGQIGIDVTLDSRTRSLHFAELQNGELEFYMLGWGVPPLDSDYVFNFLYHTNTGDRGSWNHTGFSNERVDELTVGISQETDIEQRDEMIAEIWEIVNDDITYLPVHNQVLAWAMRDDIEFPVQSENTPMFKYMEFTD